MHYHSFPLQRRQREEEIPPIQRERFGNERHKNDFTSAISIDVIFSSINFSKGFLLLFLRLRATKIPLLNNDAFYLTVRCLERSRLTSISPPPSHCVRPTVSRTD